MCNKSKAAACAAARILALILIVGMYGCGKEEADPSGERSYGQLAAEECVPLKMLLIGDEPDDLLPVQEALSGKLLEEINATISIQYLPWSDFRIKYDIVLASMDQLDLIYTSDWCFYQREAVRGSFYEITDDFAEAYMPDALANTPPEAIRQARIGGKLYMMPKSLAEIEGESWIAIRGDLREKYGLPPIENIDHLETYFHLIARNEPDVVPYDASGEVPLFPIFGMRQSDMTAVSFGYPWITRYQSEEHIPSPSEIELQYMTPEYEDFVRRMKQYADWGFWPKYALSSENRPIDSFIKGTSASLIWNQIIFTAGERLRESNPDWFAEYVDLYPDSIRRLSPYTNDGTAISAFSPYPERAAMCINLFKSDQAANDLLKGGIEGVHWIDVGEGLYEPGPKAGSYPWNHSQWAFNLPKEMSRKVTALTREQLEFDAEQLAKVRIPAFSDFRFDHSPVAADWLRIVALESEYKSILELGLTDNPVETLKEFRNELYGAGLETVEAEYFRQYEEWRKEKRQ